MAIVGDAYVMIHAITSGIDKDIKDGFKDVDKHGGRSGDRAGRAFSRGFKRGGGSGWFKKFERESIAANKKFQSLTRAGYTLAPLLSAAAGTIGVLGTSLVSLGSIIGAITLPAMVVLGGAMMSLAQAAITVKLAFSGVAKAISAGNKAAKKGADNAKAIEKANKALIRAQRALAKAYEDAAKSELRAKRDLVDAEKELHKAREQAIEDLQQLGFDSEDAAIAEQRAGIELEKARETLARVSDLPPNSRARKEAELAFAEADLNYRRAIDKNNDLKKTEAKNAAMGTFKQQVDGQENVVSAIRAVSDATENLTETKLENARAIQSATENRDDAAEALADIKKNKAGADAYADALKDLSPEAQRFVKYIVSLKDEFKKLKAFAGKDLFPLLEKAIDNLVKNLFPKLGPLLQGTGKVLGEIAVGFSKTVTKAENLKRLEKIWKTNDKFLGKLGKAVNNLYEVFLILLDAAEPLIDAFGDWLVNVTGAWKQTLLADEATGKLANRFKIAKGIFSDLGKIFSNVFGGLGKLFDANTGPGSGGQIFLNYFKDITEKFKNLKTIDGKPLKEFFAGAAKNGVKLLELLGKIFSAFFNMADDEALGIFYDNIGKAVDILASIDMSGAIVSISKLFITFADFVKLVTDSGSIEIFFGVLDSVLRKLNEFLKSELGQSILKTAAKILPFLAAFGFIAKIGGFAIKVVAGAFFRLKNVIMIVWKAFQKVGRAINAVRLFLVAFTQVFGGAATAALVGFVAGIVALIAILVGAYTQSEKFRKSIAELGRIIKERVIANFEKIKKAINDVFGGGGPRATMENFKKVLKSIGDWIAKYVMPYVKILAAFIVDSLGGAITAVIYIIGALKDAFMVTFNLLKGVFKLLTGDFSGAGEAFKAAFASLLSFFKNIGKAIYALLEPYGALFIKLLGPLWEPLKKGFQFVWEGIKFIWNLLVAGVKFYIGIIKAVFNFVWEPLKTGLEFVWNGIKFVWDIIINAIKFYIGIIKTVLTAVWSVLQPALEIAWKAIQVIWDIILAAIKVTIAVIGAILKGVWAVLKPALEIAWKAIQVIWNIIVAAIKVTIAVISAILKAVWSVLQPALEIAWKAIQVIWDIILAAIKVTIAVIGAILKGVWAVLKPALEIAWKAIQVIWNIIVAAIKVTIAVISAILKAVWTVLKTGLEIAWAAVQVVWGLIKAGVERFINGIKVIVGFVWDVLSTALTTAWNLVKGVWNTIVSGVKGFINLVKTPLLSIWNGIKTGLEIAYSVIKTIWSKITGFVTGLKASITKAAAGLWDGLKSGLSVVINWIITAFNMAIKAINLLLKGVKFATFGKVNFQIAPIPPVKLAKGGVVMPSAGGTLATIGEAGRPERVEPLDADGLSVRDRAIITELSGGGKGTTINMVINPSADMDERELAAIVSRQIAFQLRRGAA